MALSASAVLVHGERSLPVPAGSVRCTLSVGITRTCAASCHVAAILCQELTHRYLTA